MFRCEVGFDEEKVKQYNYSLKAIWELVDDIFERKGVLKVAEGVYEDLDAEDGWYTYYFSYSFFNCPPIVHFCNYWKMYDPEEGDQGDGVPLLIKCRDTVHL